MKGHVIKTDYKEYLSKNPVISEAKSKVLREKGKKWILISKLFKGKLLLSSYYNSFLFCTPSCLDKCMSQET